MKGRLRLLLALLLWLPGAIIGGPSLIAAASPAGETQGTISNIRSADGALDFVLGSQGLPGNASIVTSTVRVSLQGKEVEAEAAAATEAVDTPEQRVILTVDISASMNQGGRLDAAKEAANAYLNTVAPNVFVGLVTFNEEVSLAVEPTTNREQVREAVAGLEASGDTALYDAIIQSLGFVGETGPRSVVLLSDGENDTDLSPTTLEQAVAAVQATQGDIDVNIVAIGTAPEFLDPLQQLANAAGGGQGKVLASDELEQITLSFEEAAQSVNRQVFVNARLPVDFAGGDVTIEVVANISDGTTIRAERVFPIAVAPSPPAATEAPDYGPKPVAAPAYPIGPEILPVSLVAIFAGLATIVAFALLTTVTTDSRQGRISRRLSFYSLTGRRPQKQSETTTTSLLGSSALARSAVELAGRVVAQRNIESALATRLDSAGLLLKPAEWTLLHLGAGLATGLLFLLLSSGGIVAGLVGLILGLAGPQIYLTFQRSRRHAAFLAQLPDTLQLMAGSLSVGYSLPQAVDTVVREGAQPVSGEFNRALVQSRLGVPVEDALDTVARRLGSKDLTWAVMAIRIQREVGGNLSEVLLNVAGTLRERERLHRQVRVLSAEGRLSAWILSLLPIAFTLYLVLVRPEYLRPLYTTPLGWLLVVVGSVLLVVGVLWLRKTVKVEV